MIGRIHVYTGDGKGKTTAAVGLAVRACGAGLRVFFAQFLKDGSSSEIRLLRERCPEIAFAHFGTGRFVTGTPSDEEAAAAHAGLTALEAALTSSAYDVVIADEINVACRTGCLGLADVLHLLELRPAHVELVLTGRNADAEVIARADLVTEMKEISHYFSRQQAARRGIEL